MALTDHDTVAGVPAAVEAGARVGIRVVGGCEFSSAAPWGEMHVLGYFLPCNSAELESFLERCRADRVRRGREMVTRLQRLGVALEFDDVLRQSNGAAVGRPHVARAIVTQGSAIDVSDAFDRYIGRGRPAFVDKTLPAFREITELVHSVRGMVSVAHIKERGTRSFLERLKREGLDAVETRHPSHSRPPRAAHRHRASGSACSRPAAATGMAIPSRGRPTARSGPRTCRWNGWNGWRSCGPARPAPVPS